MTRKVVCECGLQAKLVGGDVMYPRRPDLKHKKFWQCKCGAYVGTHESSKDHQPLGTLANEPTRRARNAAHAAFDPIWRGGELTRRQAYEWLAGELGIHENDCHIAMFTIEQCARVVAAVKARKPSGTINGTQRPKATTPCNRCELPISFVMRNGKWCPVNPDGSDHIDLCRQTQVERVKAQGRKFTDKIGEGFFDSAGKKLYVKHHGVKQRRSDKTYLRNVLGHKPAPKLAQGTCDCPWNDCEHTRQEKSK